MIAFCCNNGGYQISESSFYEFHLLPDSDEIRDSEIKG